MKQEELILKLKMLGDVSDIKKNLDSVQGWLSKVGSKLDVKQTAKLTDKTRELAQAYKKYMDLVNQPNKSNANLRQLENLSSKITKNYQELGDELKQIDFTQFDIEIDPKVLDALNAAIKEASKGLEDFNNKQLTELKKAFNDNPNAGKKGILHDIKAAVDDGSVEKLTDEFARLTKNKDRFTGDNKALADSVHTILQNMVGPLDQANEEARKARQASEQAKIAKQQEEEAVVANTEAINQENLAKGFSAEQTDKVIQENLQFISTETQAAQAADQFRQRILYLVSAANGVQIIRRAFQQTYQAVKELDDVMTQMAVVTTKSVGDYWKELPEYTERAYALGAAIKDVYASMTLYYQQGLNTQQATALSNATMKMARIAGLEAAEATDRMTAAMRGFNMALNAINADNVADVYSALAATSAADVDEISTAMTKVASIAHSANMEFETTSALLTAIIETTRESAETAGTALKTVIARFSEVKTLYSTGELTSSDEEGEEIDVNKISKALRVAGINLNEYLTGAKGLDDIFLELSKKWDTLDIVTQRYIATMAAGSRQQSRFIAMMQNYSRNMELVTTAENAAGASTEQFNKTLESLDAKMNQLKTQWQSFTTTIFDQKAIKIVITTATKFLEIINSITGSSWIAKIAAGSAAFLGVRAAVTKTIPVLTTYASKLADISKAQAIINKLGNRTNLTTEEAKALESANFLLNTQVSLRTKITDLIGINRTQLEAVAYAGKDYYNISVKELAIREALNSLGVKDLTNQEYINILNREDLSTETKALAIKIAENEHIETDLALQKAINLTENKGLITKNLQITGQKILNALKLTEFTTTQAILVGTLAISAAVLGIITLAKFLYNNSLKGISEKIQQQTEDWENTKSELESINNELETIKEKLKELQEQGKVDFVSEGEINELKNQIRELEAERERLQKEADEQEKEANENRLKYLKQFAQNRAYEYVNINGAPERVYKGFSGFNNLAKEDVLEVYNSVIKGASEGFIKANQEIITAWAQAAYKTGAFSFDVAASYINLDFDREKFNQELLQIFNENQSFEGLENSQIADIISAHLSEVNKGVFDTLIAEDKHLLDIIKNMIGEVTEAVTTDDLAQNINDITKNFKLLNDAADEVNQVFDDLSTHGYVTTETLDKLHETFGDVKNYQKYADILANVEQYEGQHQEALNKLYTAYIDENKILDQLGEHNKALAIAELDRLGVENARDVVLDRLIQDELELLASQKKLFDATGNLTAEGDELIKTFQQEGWSAENLADRLELLKVANWNLALASEDQITGIIAVVNKYGQESQAALNLITVLEKLAAARASMTRLEAAKDKLPAYQYALLSAGLQAQIDNLAAEAQAASANVIAQIGGSTGVGIRAGYSGGSSSSSGGGSSSKADQWENDYDRLYNLLERIEDEQRVLNHLQEQYNDLIKDPDTHDSLVQNLKDQEASLKRLQEYYEELKRYREQELANAKSRYSGLSNYIKVVTVGDNQLVHIDWENIDAIDNSDLYDQVKAAEDEYNRIIESLNEANDKLDTVDDDLIKLRESWRKDIIDFKNRIKEALIKQAQDRIDALENTNKAIDDANKSLLDNINNAISEERTQRERAEQEQTLADQRRQLAYLMQDTTGANELAIKELQKQIAEGEQDYTDQLIDDKINELEKQNDEAAAAREKQIEIMQDQLDWFSANGGFWEQVNNLIGNGDDLLPDKEALFDLFKNFDNFNAMSAEEQEQFEEELLHDIENVSAELGAYGDEIPNPDIETGINEAGNSYLDNGDTAGTPGAGGAGSLTLDDGMIRAVAAATWAKYTVGKDYGWGEGWDRWNKYDAIFGPGASDKIQHAIDTGVGQSESRSGDWSSYSYAELLKRKRGYARGGLADFTGPAWLDGSKAHPELVLSAKDSENFIQLKDVLAHMYANGTGTSQTFGDSYYTFQIQVEQLSSDYDVDQVIERIQKRIEDSARYRNVNAINLMR